MYGVDVPYVIIHLSSDNPGIPAKGAEVRSMLVTCWTNFAKYGHPNGDGVPKWPAFMKENPVVMHLGATVQPGPVPEEAALKVLEACFAW